MSSTRQFYRPTDSRPRVVGPNSALCLAHLPISDRFIEKPQPCNSSRIAAARRVDTLAISFEFFPVRFRVVSDRGYQRSPSALPQKNNWRDKPCSWRTQRHSLARSRSYRTLHPPLFRVLPQLWVPPRSLFADLERSIQDCGHIVRRNRRLMSFSNRATIFGESTCLMRPECGGEPDAPRHQWLQIRGDAGRCSNDLRIELAR